jgi:hypothetical protein
MRSIGRLLTNTYADEATRVRRRRDARKALIATGLALVVLLAFVGWLLVGSPPRP